MTKPLELNVGETVYDPDGSAWHVGMCASLGGERYYWLVGYDGVVSMLPASATAHLTRRLADAPDPRLINYHRFNDTEPL